MTQLQHFVVLVVIGALTLVGRRSTNIKAFQLSPQPQQRLSFSSTHRYRNNDSSCLTRRTQQVEERKQQQHQRQPTFLKAIVNPISDEDGTQTQSVVGIVGRGYLPTLCAKLCALDGYQTWMVTPTEEMERIESLIYSPKQPEINALIKQNLSLVEASDVEALEDFSAKTNAFLLAVDTDAVLTEDVIDFLIPSSSKNLKRIVGMSRNLNGKGMGFFVKASKVSANNEVWCADDSLVKQYQQFERKLASYQDLGIATTIVRAGTLKGGGCGDETYSLELDEEGTGNSYFPRYLSSKFYEYTKKDIVTWQLLFDCNVRGVLMKKGDQMEGPGIKAAFTATSNEECLGDTSRCSIAEAMVKSLKHPNTINIDFGIATKAQRTPLSNDEWNTLFDTL